MPHPDPRTRPGFALPAVIVVVAAMLILAIGVLLLTGVERGTSRSFVDRQRADLAAKSALENVRSILTAEAANDDFIVIQSTPSSPVVAGRDASPYLFLVRGKAEGSGYSYRYLPLFSSLAIKSGSEKNTSLAAPKTEDFLQTSENARIAYTTLPYLDKARTDWLPVQDEKGRTVARYAFWIEDLQGKLDPKIAGNTKGDASTHARVAWPFPAPGMNDMPASSTQPSLDQIALFTMDPTATWKNQKTVGANLLKNRPYLISPESALAGAMINPPLVRMADGHLADEKSRAIEESLAPALKPYLEQPLVPYAAGIKPDMAAKPKLNLNKLLKTGGAAAVDEMTQQITKALPNFDTRKGGFPDDYARTLAANAIDYADADKASTTDGGSYRGVDAYPLVSEFLLKARWENIRTVGGRKLMDLSVSIFVEVWNMTDQTVSGDLQVSYETKYKFQIPPNPNFFSLGDLTKATHNLTQGGGYWWFPAIPNVSLSPNEYRVFKCGTVNYSFDAIDAAGFIASPLSLTGETLGSSGAGYRIMWNGQIVDQSRGAIHRNDCSLNYPSDTKSQPRSRVRTTIPSQSHNDGSFIDNMGDPRMSFYNQSPQDANVYPENYSPNRRNIRSGTIYSPTNTNTIYGRVLPSEWPDGGHDSPFGTDSIAALLSMTQTSFSGDSRIEPNDPRFFTAYPYNYNNAASLALAKAEAPTRISNLGRFYSVSELGRVYDPLMWQVRAKSDSSNSPGRGWGDVLVSSTASGKNGGGNTLRIGRPEHPAFDQAGKRASHLLDLFHVGQSRSDDASLREGSVAEINGHVNLNTASKTVLRALIAGPLAQDSEIRKFTGDTHTQGIAKYPTYSTASPAPDPMDAADRIASAIIRSRPFASPAEMAHSKEQDGTSVFGNPKIFPEYASGSFPALQWTDSAAEETFARAYDSGTVRSRNFRVWVVAQSVVPYDGTADVPAVATAEVRKRFTVFADPGERKSDGSIDPLKYKIRIIDENDF